MKSNDDQIAYWNGPSGKKWAEDQEKLDASMQHLADVIVAAAAPQAGEFVIDIGGGAGGTALQLADAVGPTGRVLGVDVSAPMLAVARSRAKGRDNVLFIEADATTYAFEPRAADLIFSKFGVMFFEDPLAAFTNLYRALKPSGRLAFLCWRSLAENPFATVPMGAALKHVPSQGKPDPFAPGPFALADEQRTRRILEQAGFVSPKFAAFDSQMVVGFKAETAARESVVRGMASRLLMDADDATKEKVVADLTATYEKLMTPNGVSLGANTWVVTAST